MKNYKFLFINGPNINLLGKREPEIYGKVNYKDLVNIIKEKCEKLKIIPEIFQSNSESDLIEKIQESEDIDLIIANLGAYTHTSIAIRDALLAINKPVIEVHISNIFKREKFRHVSFIGDISVGIISGFGIYSYVLAIEAGINFLKKR